MNISHRNHRLIEHKGLTIPSFFYGTAWKEDQTEPLTYAAIASGFLGIDTANQRRHYYEAGVGKAVQRVLNEGRLQRSDLFLQTKFTYANSQDHRLPYDADADYATQVRQSCPKLTGASRRFLHRFVHFAWTGLESRSHRSRQRSVARHGKFTAIRSGAVIGSIQYQ
jgi:hypothetical protein